MMNSESSSQTGDQKNSGVQEPGSESSSSPAADQPSKDKTDKAKQQSGESTDSTAGNDVLNQSLGLKLAIQIAALALAVVVLVYLAFFVRGPFVGDNPGGESVEVSEEEDSAYSAAVEVTDTVVGDGPVLEEGMEATLHYRGTLEDGTIFDNSYDRQQPFVFVLGQGAVIEGWEQGLLGMKTGGKRTLVVPPELAFGEEGRQPDVPPGATLIFEIELLGVKAVSAAPY